jgi:hypothetical protein
MAILYPGKRVYGETSCDNGRVLWNLKKGIIYKLQRNYGTFWDTSVNLSKPPQVPQTALLAWAHLLYVNPQFLSKWFPEL